jgi:hypothetical protein
MKSKICNLFTVVPLALWGGTTSFISRALMSINSTEERLNLLIAIAFMNIIFIMYYILLHNYLKNQQNDVERYKLYCTICAVLGTAFTIFSFAITNYKH